MCDDITEAENEVFLAKARLNRREVGLGAGAAVAAALVGCPPPPPDKPETQPATTATPKASATASASPPADSNGRMVTIKTPDGSAEAFFAAPATGKHPGVLLWPDVAGLRDAYKKMATQLAAAGYAVLSVNPYYRSTKLPLFATISDWIKDRDRVKPMRKLLTHEAIGRDAAAFAAWLDEQKEVDTGRKLATTGYCMTGPFTFRTAAAVPERVGAIASFHGGGLVTEEATSPHKLLAKIKATALICIAENDHARQPEAKMALEKAAKEANVTAEIEVYPAQHGWCTLDAPIYDKTQAERAWSRLLAMLKKL